MSATHISLTSPEWPAMWEALADACGDYADCCPETGEVWQYMCTEHGRHQFRHRSRPERSKAGRVLPPIKGYAGRHVGRVYLHLDVVTLQVVRLVVRPYLDDTPSEGLTTASAIQRARDSYRAKDHSKPFPTSRREYLRFF